jgi:hypothetical protein
MKPKSAKRRLLGMSAKPGSNFVVLSSVRRIHARLGIRMASSSLVTTLLKSMLSRYVKAFGIDALLPERKEPFTPLMITAMLRIPAATSVAGCSSAKELQAVQVLMALLAQTAFRLAEAIGISGDAHKNGLTWSSIAYFWKGMLYASLPPEALAMMGPSDYVLVKTGSAKADQFGLHWASFPVYLPWDTGTEINAAQLIVQWDLRNKVPPSERASTPLFQTDSGSVFTRSKLESALKDMLHIIGIAAGDISKYSYHGFRSFLACALLEAGASAERIQGMCRWLSEDSLKLYARDNRHVYANWISKAMKAQITSVQATNVPEIDDDIAWIAIREYIQREA